MNTTREGRSDPAQTPTHAKNVTASSISFHTCDMLSYHIFHPTILLPVAECVERLGEWNIVQIALEPFPWPIYLNKTILRDLGIRQIMSHHWTTRYHPNLVSRLENPDELPHGLSMTNRMPNQSCANFKSRLVKNPRPWFPSPKSLKVSTDTRLTRIETNYFKIRYFTAMFGARNKIVVHQD